MDTEEMLELLGNSMDEESVFAEFSECTWRAILETLNQWYPTENNELLANAIENFCIDYQAELHLKFQKIITKKTIGKYLGACEEYQKLSRNHKAEFFNYIDDFYALPGKCGILMFFILEEVTPHKGW